MTPEELNAFLARVSELPETQTDIGLVLSANWIRREGVPVNRESRKGIPAPKVSAALAGKPRPDVSAMLTGRVRPDISAALKGRVRPDIAEIRSKPCTVDDGVTVYPSRKAMIEVLGQGKLGRKHPNFRYLTAEEIAVWQGAD